MTSIGGVQTTGAGERMRDCAALFPFCRSITGDGVRATLNDIERSRFLSRSTRCHAARRRWTGRSRRMEHWDAYVATCPRASA